MSFDYVDYICLECARNKRVKQVPKPEDLRCDACDMKLYRIDELPILVRYPERISINNARITDLSGRKIDTVKINQRIHITADITNNQNHDQKLIYLVQMDSTIPISTSLKTVCDTLAAGKTSCWPQEFQLNMDGDYTAKIFSWKSGYDQIALFKPTNVTVCVVP
ncbi:hypothetical protein CENSYa_0973 [Cenarchaeum symbiosum A]|uniref:Uncharacterized protein n=1 Tax=Cenarchaeum symbiosum (strain A) TaxID=414004 RepID=A0RW88_CENSY|nr:hypothetical protein CENSYa_0973 [Cenarchaeum symbiosum A]